MWFVITEERVWSRQAKFWIHDEQNGSEAGISRVFCIL
jgi:hypothetical protein